MKKYSTEYFRDKFEVLYKRLLEKQGFIDEIKQVRKQLGIPEQGFQKSLEFSQYLMDRLNKKEKMSTTALGFLEQLEASQGKRIGKDDLDEAEREFNRHFKEGFVPMVILIAFEMHQEQHSDFYTKDKLIAFGNKNAELYGVTKKIFDKYMGIDLLDPHIIMHFVEKYLFLGDNGVQSYISKKLACPNCRYIGVNHFSPHRHNMKGQDLGPFSGKYLFNDETVKMLSGYFDSVFVLIKPYATKEEVIQYINDNWNDLKEHVVEKNTFYKQFGINVSKIKKSDIDKNRLVYELNKLSKKELINRYKGEEDFNHSSVYKEAIVSAILNEEYGIQMSTDAIKKTAARFAKSKELRRTPKDIRDI